MKLKQFLLTLAFCSAGVAHSAPINLVVNGSFEAPDVATWTVFKSIPGWTTQGAGVEIRNDGTVGDTDFGQQYAELDSHGANSNSSILQTIVTKPGQIYQLGFYYSPRINQPSSTNGISAFWNGTLLGNIAFPGSSVNVWQLFTFNVFGTGSDVLKFTATGTQDTLGGNIDNVSVNAVPVPAAAWLFASAMGLFGLSRRNKSV